MESLSIDDFTESLVFGDLDPRVAHCCPKDDVVFGFLEFLCHPLTIVPVTTPGTFNHSVHSLIGKATQNPTQPEARRKPQAGDGRMGGEITG